MDRWRHRGTAGAQDRPVAWRFRLGLFLLLPGAALIQLAARSAPDAVEVGYSRRIYPVLREFVGTLTGWLAWSLSELLLVLLVLLVLLRAVRAVRGLWRGARSPRNVLAHAVSFVLAALGVLYGWGVLGWGLNYQRRPLAQSAGLDTSPATVTELHRLARSLAAEAGDLRRWVHEDQAGVMGIVDSKREALVRAAAACARSGTTYEVLQGGSCPRPKAVLLPLLSWLRLGGVFSMFTSEANVNMHQPVTGMLVAACHELAHQLGWAREQEAGFVGYALCRLHPDADFRYAATQEALAHALGALRRADRDAALGVHSGLDPGLLRDWEAERRFWRRYDTPIAEAGQWVNDAYLKSQGQEEGIAGYGQVIDLLVADQRRAARREGG